MNLFESTKNSHTSTRETREQQGRLRFAASEGYARPHDVTEMQCVSFVDVDGGEYVMRDGIVADVDGDQVRIIYGKGGRNDNDITISKSEVFVPAENVASGGSDNQTEVIKDVRHRKREQHNEVSARNIFLPGMRARIIRVNRETGNEFTQECDIVCVNGDDTVRVVWYDDTHGATAYKDIPVKDMRRWNSDIVSQATSESQIEQLEDAVNIAERNKQKAEARRREKGYVAIGEYSPEHQAVHVAERKLGDVRHNLRIAQQRMVLQEKSWIEQFIHFMEEESRKTRMLSSNPRESERMKKSFINQMKRFKRILEALPDDYNAVPSSKKEELMREVTQKIRTISQSFDRAGQRQSFYM